MSENSRPKRYFAWHFRIMRFLGLGWWHHPDEENTENFPGWYLYYSILTQIVCVAGFVSLETIDPFVGKMDMDRFMFSISFVITHNLTVIKASIFFLKNGDLQAIARTLEIEMYDYYQNDEKNRATAKFTKLMSGSFVFFGWMTILNTDAYGIMQDCRWKSAVKNLNDSSERPFRPLPHSIYIPWDYQREGPFILTFILETVGLLWTGHIVLITDTLIATIILHMSAQFETLNEAIITAYDRTMSSIRHCLHHNAEHEDGDSDVSDTEDGDERIVKSLLTEEEIEIALQTTFKDCFRQHQVLINCVQKFSEAYSYGFVTQLLSSTTAICAVMVQISQDASSLKSVKLVTSIAFFAAMIIQLAIQCFTGNELSLQAVGISDAVMQCKWERAPPRLRRQLLMMMVRAQRPLRLTAAGFAQIDNLCFVAIMKAAYSYYAVLGQTVEK